jgi:phage I-like protein
MPDQQFTKTVRGWGEVITSTRIEKLGGEPPEWVRLFKAGENRYDDGTFIYSARSETEVLSYYADKGTDPVWDWEHQTLLGERAPASGWTTKLEGRSDGLWSRQVWTETGAADLRAGSYRYFSCVFDVDTRTNEIVKLHHVALTNWPGEKGQEPLTERIAATARAGKTKREKREGGMDKETVRCLIRWGAELPATATNNDVRSYITKLIENIPADDNLFILDNEENAAATTVAQRFGIAYADAKDAATIKLVAQKVLLDELDLPETATVAQAHARIGDLKTNAGEVVQLRSENATLKQKLVTSAAKSDDEKLALLIQSNRKRIPPAKEAWVRAVAQKHGIEHATDVVKNMPEVLPDSGAAEAETIEQPVPATTADGGTRRVNEKAAARKARVEKVMRENPKLSYEEASDELYRRDGQAVT